ncbi:MAG: LysR family transcriptional regulator [Firmicutes bacterium]|nr:LysR family transcriptional regulator [Bacillota bacterium]MBR3706352.1 LysR family transcriptional regulator [Bacillota bacterium]
MDIKVLKNFVKIAETGSISKAAKELHLSQPPLTKQMQALEESLGVRLFNRSVKGIELTEGGKLLYSHAISLIAHNDLVINELTHNVGNIRFGMTSSAVEYALSIVKDFNSKCTHHFEITESSTFNLLKLLNDNLIDLAFVRTPFKIDNQFKYIKLLDDTLVVAGSPSFLNPSGKSISMAQLHELPLIIIRRWKQYVDYMADIQGFSMKYDYICDDNRTAIAMVNNNMGVAIVPASTIDRRFSQNMLVELSIENEIFDTDIYLMYRSGKQFNSATTEFLDFVTSKAIPDVDHRPFI